MKSETDVIIVGAGPTGLSLACQFIRQGIDFELIEKNESPTPFSKAMGVHARTLEIYEQMDLARPAIEGGAIAKMVNFVEGGKIRGQLDFENIGKGMSPYPFLLIFEQSKNEKLMYDYLRRHDRDVSWKTTLDHFTQDDAGVVAEYTGADGSQGQISAKYIVGCDGAKSKVRQELGLTFEGSTFERIFYVADVKLDWELSHDGLYVCLAHDAFVLFFPMQGERTYRIIGVLPEGASQEEGEALYADIEQHVKSRTELDLDITEVNWFSSYKVHTRRVDRFSAGRGFVAGDAAHIHSPAGAQGMNTGIQDAYNLAWKLACIIKGWADESLLDSYNEERLENAQRLLATTDRLFQLGAGEDWFVSFLRTTVFPSLAGFVTSFETVRKFMFPLLSQIGINYRDCKLSDHSADRAFAVKAGDRMPYVLVEGASLYDKLRAPKFHLLTFSDGQTDHREIAARAATDWTELLDHQIVPLYPEIAETFGAESSFQVLLRPDNYLALIAAGSSAQVVETYFDKFGYTYKAGSRSRGSGIGG